MKSNEMEVWSKEWRMEIGDGERSGESGDD